ncbi:MAG TPA: SIS domain-containing protein [Geobacterales bacterium]|nr:SIS domain-containing protein [Geobacterales bacterium]
MNRIELILQEIRNQPKLLTEFFNSLKAKYWKFLKPENTILTGCGDSYAAALMLKQLVRVEARDPYELLDEGLGKEKLLALISVSGKTIANIKLAEKAKKEGVTTIAITGNDQSRLAQLCDMVVNIDYREKIILPGTISFTKTLLALYSLFGIDVKIQISEKIIEEFFDEFKDIRGKDFIFISSPGYFPLSIYWKAKILEMIGAKVMIERCEQFLHMDIFGVRNEDCVIVFGKRDPRCESIYDKLKEKVAFCRYIKLGDDLPEGFLIGAIAGQILAFVALNKLSLYDVHFATSDMLKISDEMIY